MRGDQILVSNLSRTAVVIFDQRGRPFIRIASGRSRGWHDQRIVETGPPPPPTGGASARDPRFVKNWRIPGRAGSQRFEIVGFLGWVPPESEDQGVSPLLLAAGVAGLAALSLAGALLLARRS